MISRFPAFKYLLPLVFACILAAGWWLRSESSFSSGSIASEPNVSAIALAQSEALEPANGEVTSSPSIPRFGPDIRTGVDASDFYKNAFALYAALTDEEKKVLKNPTEEVDADAAAALFKKIQPIMDLLRQAASADFCDWGTGPLKFDSLMPQIPKSVELGRLALWEAAYRYTTDPAGALDDLGVRAALGHHIADSLIGLLVQVSFERSAGDWIRTQSPGMDPAIADRASAFLSGSTVEANLTRAFSTEAAAIASIAERMSAGGEEAERLIAALFQPGNELDQGQRAEIESTLRDPQRLNAEFEYMQSIENEMVEAVTWPEARFQEWWKAVQLELKDHPLAEMTMPSLTSVRTRVQQTRIERQMLSAGLAIQQGGPTQAALFHDPVTGAPFSYIPQPGGFELHSTWQSKGKPVSMRFATAQ